MGDSVRHLEAGGKEGKNTEGAVSTWEGDLSEV